MCELHTLMVLSSDKIAFGKGLLVTNRKLPTTQKEKCEKLGIEFKFTLTQSLNSRRLHKT